MSDSGQMRLSTSARTWSSYWKRGTASSGWWASVARAMRPVFCASNSGRRPPCTRLWTSEVMNHRLAGARQAGHAKPQCRLHEAGGTPGERVQGDF